MFTLIVKIQLSVYFNVVFHKDSYFGPYFLFVNDMFIISNVLFNVLFNLLYADDTCNYLRGIDNNALFGLFNVELNLLYEWLNATKFTLNIDKTLYMIFFTGPVSKLISLV